MKCFNTGFGTIAIVHIVTTSLAVATPPPRSQNTTSNPTLSPGSDFAQNPFATLQIDAFNDTKNNALGYFHGLSGETAIGDFDDANPGNELIVSTDNIDGKPFIHMLSELTEIASFVTSLGEGCVDFSSYRDQYIHIVYSGSSNFTVSLQQHNKACNESQSPFPETYDSVQAARYVTPDQQHIYIPVSQFRVDITRVTGIAIENWCTRNQTIIYRIEMVQSAGVPVSVKSVARMSTGTLWAGCVNPNHIAFGIDDGVPELMAHALQIIKDEEIPVTFFVQGSALLLTGDNGNFTAAYREMISLGHQIGLHTKTHPHMEAVRDQEEIDYEISENTKMVKEKLGVDTNYFRPPYGTIGARTRQALGKLLPNPQIIMWSIDVRDWVYGVEASGDPDRLQYKAFADQLNAGGTIVVMHYLYKSTVDQFRDMIHLAKSQGRKFVRMDECIGQV